MGTRSKGMMFDGYRWVFRCQHGRTYNLPKPPKTLMVYTTPPRKRRYRRIRRKR